MNLGDIEKELKELLEALEYFGIKGEISVEELKSRYRERLKKLHPDKGGVETDEIRNLNRYYKILLRYLESYRIPVDEESIINSKPEYKILKRFGEDKKSIGY